MESEDEDVIFENSVLHQALIDAGIANIETEPRLQMEPATWDSPSDGDTETERLDFANIKNTLSSMPSGFMTGFFLGNNILDEVHHYYRYQTLKRLISSRLLSEEDRLFLQFFVEEEAPAKDPTKCLTVRVIPFCSVLVLSLLLLNLLPLTTLLLPWILLCMEMMPFLSELQLCPHLISLVVVNLIWLLFIVIPLINVKRRIEEKVLSQVKERDKVLQDLETGAWELIYLERKCLRLIKESELIALGFTIASQHNLVFRMGQSHTSSASDHSYPELRHILLTGNVALMTDLKKWVVKMLRGIPMITADSDFNTLEVLTLDPSNSDVDLTTRTAGDPAPNNNAQKEQMDVPQNSITPMANLSKSVNLLSIYISGFMRRLALSFYQHNLRDKSLDPFLATQECAMKSVQAIEHVRNALNQSYTYCRAVHQAYEQIGETEDLLRTKQRERSEVYNLYICVNSLDLHLQSMQKVTRDLRMTLESRIDDERRRQVGIEEGVPAAPEEDGEVKNISAEDRESWKDMLRRVKVNMDACKGCYDESVKHLSQRTNTETAAPGPPGRDPSPSSKQPQQSKVRVIPAEDPVIVDQVFEAMSEAVDDDIPQSRPRYTAEDRARLKEQRETMKLLRQELEAVVGHRAIHQREREEKALARARGEDEDEGRGGFPAGGNLTVPAAPGGPPAEAQCSEIESVATGDVVGEGEPQSRAGELMEQPPTSSHMSEQGRARLSELERLDLRLPSSVSGQVVHHATLALAHDMELKGSPPTQVEGEEPELTAGDSKSQSTHKSKLKSALMTSAKKRKQRQRKTTSGNVPKHVEFEAGGISNIGRDNMEHWRMCKEMIHGDKEERISTSTTSSSSSRSRENTESSDQLDISFDKELPLSEVVSAADAEITDTESPEIIIQDSPTKSISSSSCVPDIESAITSFPDTALPNSCTTSTSSSSSGLMKSQIICPKSVDPEQEGFTRVGGGCNSRCISRHYFTASEGESEIQRALDDLRSRNASSATPDVPNPVEESVHLLEMGADGDHNYSDIHRHDSESDKWVKISLHAKTTENGSRVELLRQKDINLAEVLNQSLPPLPSPDPNSSFTKSIAQMAAAHARNFSHSLMVGEQFGDESSDSEQDGNISE